MILYCPSWGVEWTPCEIVRVIHPGGWLDRLFGGHSPVYVIRVRGESPFATSAINLKGI